MIVLGREFLPQRWPWQDGYNWQGMAGCSAPLNQPRKGDTAAPRFGGGWKYKIGIQFSSSDYIYIELLYGAVIIRKAQRCAHCGKRMAKKDQARGFAMVAVPGKGHFRRDKLHKACIEELERGHV